MSVLIQPYRTLPMISYTTCTKVVNHKTVFIRKSSRYLYQVQEAGVRVDMREMD